MNTIERIHELDRERTKLVERVSQLESEATRLDDLYSITVKGIAEGSKTMDDFQKVKDLQSTNEAERLEAVKKLQNFDEVYSKISHNLYKELRKQEADEVDEYQTTYNEQAAKVIEARNNFLRELEALGRVESEVSKVAAKYSPYYGRLGHEPKFFHSIDKITLAKKPPHLNNGQVHEVQSFKTLGVDYMAQLDAKNGNLDLSKYDEQLRNINNKIKGE